jgi:hypothetical protein
VRAAVAWDRGLGFRVEDGVVNRRSSGTGWS